MGADSFLTRSKGTSAEEAFQDAVGRARHEHGHHGYTGTIAEKTRYLIIDEDLQSLTNRVARAIDRVNRQPATAYARETTRLYEQRLANLQGIEAHALTPRSIADTLLLIDDSRITDKWGPAGCLRAGNGEYVFFGWASL